jgi:hypothetical protein
MEKAEKWKKRKMEKTQVNLLFFKPNGEKPLKVHTKVCNLEYLTNCHNGEKEKVSGLVCSDKKLNEFLYKEMRTHDDDDDEDCKDEGCDHYLCHSSVVCLLLPDHTIKYFLRGLFCESKHNLDCDCNWKSQWHNAPTWQYE